MHISNTPDAGLVNNKFIWQCSPGGTSYFLLIKVWLYTGFQIVVVLDSASSKPAVLLLFEMTYPLQTLMATDLEKRIAGGIVPPYTENDIENQFPESVLTVTGREDEQLRLFDQTAVRGFQTAGTRWTCLCLKWDRFLHYGHSHLIFCQDKQRFLDKDD